MSDEEFYKDAMDKTLVSLSGLDGKQAVSVLVNCLALVLSRGCETREVYDRNVARVVDGLERLWEDIM